MLTTDVMVGTAGSVNAGSMNQVVAYVGVDP